MTALPKCQPLCHLQQLQIYYNYNYSYNYYYSKAFKAIISLPQRSLARPLFDSHHRLSLNSSVKQSQIALAILLKIGRYCLHLFCLAEFLLENDAELSQECFVWIGIHMNMKF